MKKLFCFDFDNTLVKGHFHSQLTNQGIVPVTDDNTLIINGIIQDDNKNKNEQYDKELVKERTRGLLENSELGIQDPEGLKSLFNNILSSGHKIAITSFTKYPEAIEMMLNHLALTPEQIKDINIIGGFPKDGPRDPNCKTEHIESAMYLAEVYDEHDVVLIDDSKNNIEHAKQQNIQTVHVEKGRADWSVVQKMVNISVPDKTTEVSQDISVPSAEQDTSVVADTKLPDNAESIIGPSVELRKKNSTESSLYASHRGVVVLEHIPPPVPPKSDEARQQYNLLSQNLKKGETSNAALHDKLQQELKQKISLKKNQSSFGR